MNVALLTGGVRKQSTSTKLANYVKQLLEERGHLTELFDLYATPLPLYNADNKNAGDPQVRRLSELMQNADAIVLSTPEYHGSVSGPMKNALDYLGKDHFRDKLVLSMSSAGGAVGVSSLTHLQTMVRYVHGINCPEWISIGSDDRVFNDQGEPLHQHVRERVIKVVDYFSRFKLNKTS